MSLLRTGVVPEVLKSAGGGRSTRVTGPNCVVVSSMVWSHENRETNRKTVKVCTS